MLSHLALSGNNLKTVDGNVLARMPGKTYLQPAATAAIFKGVTIEVIVIT